MFPSLHDRKRELLPFRVRHFRKLSAVGTARRLDVAIP
jgi:hypothetical protein